MFSIGNDSINICVFNHTFDLTFETINNYKFKNPDTTL